MKFKRLRIRVCLPEHRVHTRVLKAGAGKGWKAEAIARKSSNRSPASSGRDIPGKNSRSSILAPDAFNFVWRGQAEASPALESVDLAEAQL